MEINSEELVQARAEVLAFYSPYTFIRKIKLPEQFSLFVRPALEKFGTVDSCRQMEVTAEGRPFVFLYEHVAWDSHYFGRPCYKLFTVLFSGKRASALIKAIGVFKATLRRQENCYCFAEIPAEDIFLIQCLNEAGVRMVETRLHYFKSDVAAFSGKRYSVREATKADAGVLAEVAATSRNAFDRLHADYAFAEQEADMYLATYAQAAVSGFCDYVLVPDVPNVPVASFIAFDSLDSIFPGSNLCLVHARLAAVAPENGGWYVKLLSEVIFRAQKQNASLVKVTTQAANRSVIRTLESLNFSFGSLSHILVFAG